MPCSLPQVFSRRHLVTVNEEAPRHGASSKDHERPDARLRHPGDAVEHALADALRVATHEPAAARLAMDLLAVHALQAERAEHARVIVRMTIAVWPADAVQANREGQPG